jgi:hypothetical protein
MNYVVVLINWRRQFFFKLEVKGAIPLQTGSSEQVQ